MVYCNRRISESWEDIRVKPRCCGLYILVQVKEAYHGKCVWGKVSLCYFQFWTTARGEKHLRCHRAKTHMWGCTTRVLHGNAKSGEGREPRWAPSLPWGRAHGREGGACGNLAPCSCGGNSSVPQGLLTACVYHRRRDWLVCLETILLI